MKLKTNVEVQIDEIDTSRPLFTVVAELFRDHPSLYRLETFNRVSGNSQYTFVRSKRDPRRVHVYAKGRRGPVGDLLPYKDNQFDQIESMITASEIDYLEDDYA